MALSLDGNTSVIGTEFIKLLNTGSSDLATEEYVLEQVALGGGSGDGYTQAEVDALLNNKLNVNNPQDILGTLRIDSTNGNGKLIVNAVGAPNDEDFYVNGLSNLGGTLKCQLLQASSNIETSQLIKSNTINTYANVNMTIQRNSIDYIVLESDKVNFKRDIYVNDVLLTGGGDGTFDENVVINNPCELQCNTFNNNGLNQDVVFNINSGEWLRLQFSDNTVRVPNTKSFLSQEIYFNNIRPLAFSDDVVFYGGNTANDAYEEYFRNNRTTETVDFNKTVRGNTISSIGAVDLIFQRGGSQVVKFNSSNAEFENDIKLNVDKYVKWTNCFIKEGGTTRAEFEFIANGATSHIRFWIDTNVKLALTTAEIACKVPLNAEDGITVFNGKELKTNIVNSNSNNDLSLQRNSTEIVKFNSSNEAEFSQDIKLNTIGKFVKWTNCFIREGITTTRPDFDICMNDVAGHMRFYVGSISDTSNIKLALVNDRVSCKVDLQAEDGITVFNGKEIKTNTVNSNGNIDVSFKRNDVQHMLFSSGKVEMTQPCHFNGSWVLDTADLISCSYRVEGALRICDFRNNHTAGTPAYRFMCGGGTGSDVILYITSTSIDTSRDVNIGSSYSLKSNAINSNGDNDNSFQRNGVEFFKFQSSVGVDNNDIINVAEGKGISAQHVYGNLFKSRSLGFDTIFYGSNTGATARVEYMRYNYAGESLDFNCPIDNTGLLITGNIVDTTVSDERLKTNIEDVECNFTECVKNVKIKTFEYTDEKYKHNDKYGFIAQELLENLPKEFNHIVKENKEKDSDDKYLSINYMKVNLLLWGALQEEMAKTEYLESKLFETIARVEALEKPKAKAKSKSKAKNVD